MTTRTMIAIAVIAAGCGSKSPGWYAEWEDPRGDGIESRSQYPATYFSPAIDVTAVRVATDQPRPEPADDPPDTRRVVSEETTGLSEVGTGIFLQWAVELDGPLPAPGADDDHHFVYTAALETDGDPANNWQPQGDFDWDLYGRTDWWLELIWDGDYDRASLRARRVTFDQQIETVPTDALALLSGSTLGFYIPIDELPGDQVGFRITTFGHDGAYSENDRGADVLGADPTEPLHVIEWIP